MALITCKECNAQISEFADKCPSCGAPPSVSQTSASQDFQTQQQAGYQQQSAGGSTQQETLPKSWLVESILVTILCCLPFGIAGIVSASKVESRWYAGDKEGSKKASADAAKWTKIGFFGGLIFLIIYFVLVVVGAVHGVWESSSYYDF